MADSIPAPALGWRLGAELSPAYVPRTSGYLRGVDASFGGALRADFTLGLTSRMGRMYPGVYQGFGLEMRGFGGGKLGSPASAYIYQGVPVAHFGSRLQLDCEWQFGAAFGWKHGGEDNACVSTAVTARMGVGLRVRYTLTPRWQLSAGVEAIHFSNGNTSHPNSGVNTVGASIGVAYALNPQPETAAVDETADAGVWFYDIVAYGAWRKRGVELDEHATVMLPGTFAVAGLQFAPMRRFNRYFSAGASLDVQFDESAGLAPYYVTSSSYDEPKFYRPPFGKQLSAGLSAHAELSLTFFAINAGLGYDILSPKGNKRFYQSLALKAFITPRIFLNAGYRLGDFSTPQNLMLGVGVRL